MTQTTTVRPQVGDRAGLTHADRQIIADVLTWDCQRSVSAMEIETIAIAHDIVWVKMTDNRAIPLHVETFRAIRRQQLEQQSNCVTSTDADVEYVMAIEAELEAEESEEPIEVDCTEDGHVYRVWKGIKLLGTFYRCSEDGKWIAQAAHINERRRYKTALGAQQAIVRAYQQQKRSVA